MAYDINYFNGNNAHRDTKIIELKTRRECLHDEEARLTRRLKAIHNEISVIENEIRKHSINPYKAYESLEEEDKLRYQRSLLTWFRAYINYLADPFGVPKPNSEFTKNICNLHNLHEDIFKMLIDEHRVSNDIKRQTMYYDDIEENMSYDDAIRLIKQAYLNYDNGTLVEEDKPVNIIEDIAAVYNLNADTLKTLLDKENDGTIFII